jgi:hypothetical protein
MLSCPIVPTEPAHIGKKPDSISPERTLALAATSRSPPEGIRQGLIRGEDVPPRTLAGKVFSYSCAARFHPVAGIDQQQVGTRTALPVARALSCDGLRLGLGPRCPLEVDSDWALSLTQ